MASMPFDIDVYSDALVVLGTAGIIVPIVRRWGWNPIIAYLAAGALLGPLGLGSYLTSVPALYWFTIVDAQNVSGIAELGIVFLLFLIGLELSLDRLLTMRRLVFGLGGLQVILCTGALAGIATLLGQTAHVSLILGACLALSSTAIVIELLSDQKRLNTNAGRSTFAVLLAQDLAVIPILVFISIMGADSEGSVMDSLLQALLQAIAALGVIVVAGRLLLRPLFRMVASAHSSELFIAIVLFVIVGSGLIAHQAGLSMALGAFVAGLLLAETEYRRSVQATVEPFKGLLLGIFFFTVGMSIDIRVLLSQPLLLLACVAGLIAVKAVLIVGLGRLFRLSWPSTTEMALLLGPGGEFAFVGIGMAATLGLVEPRISSFVLVAVSLTMVLIPLLSLLARSLSAKLNAHKRTQDPDFTSMPEPGEKRAIVVGYGRVGKVVCSLLREHGVSFIVTDYDVATITRERGGDQKIYYGDAADPNFLEACGLMDATGIIITIHAQDVIADIVARARQLRPDILIVSRARDAAHARKLYAMGATDAVPETIEASLQLSEATLVGLGVPTGPVIASIHAKRDEFRHSLQDAAQKAGLQRTHSVRARVDRRGR